MTYEFAPWPLSWDEVDPRRFPFDAAQAATVVAGLGPAASVPARPAGDRPPAEWSRETAVPWTNEMTHALAERYGRWALGWRWAHDEGDVGGGPVDAWCCATHSMTTPEQTLARVTAALVEWRGWLEDLAESFERFPLGDDRSARERRLAWEEGAAHLVTMVVERTGAGDAWYNHCRQVLTWFLTRWSVPADRAERLVHEAVSGRFESWTEPSEATVGDVAERLADSLSGET
jgi:hypothetical protein